MAVYSYLEMRKQWTVADAEEAIGNLRDEEQQHRDLIREFESDLANPTRSDRDHRNTREQLDDIRPRLASCIESRQYMQCILSRLKVA